MLQRDANLYSFKCNAITNSIHRVCVCVFVTSINVARSSEQRNSNLLNGVIESNAFSAKLLIHHEIC